MLVENKKEQSIAFNLPEKNIEVINQKVLPFKFEKVCISEWKHMRDAIADMMVRGAPLIGVSGAGALALAAKESVEEDFLCLTASEIKKARPTAVNLMWGVDRVLNRILSLAPEKRCEAAWREADAILKEDVETCRKIGSYFKDIIKEKHAETGKTVRILTHCNAGWLATVDWGTALSGIYQAHHEGIPLHVYVDETRPRLQGLITAWELSQEKIPISLIADNSGGLLMYEKGVDLVITGADRIAANGDTANKIGTYLKALSAHANNIPFYIAAPESTFDFSLPKGEEIPIEERSAEEILRICGKNDSGNVVSVELAPEKYHAWNPGFDVTPASLITAFVTEKGVFAPQDLQSGLKGEA